MYHWLSVPSARGTSNEGVLQLTEQLVRKESKLRKMKQHLLPIDNHGKKVRSLCLWVNVLFLKKHHCQATINPDLIEAAQSLPPLQETHAGMHTMLPSASMGVVPQLWDQVSSA